MSTAITQYQQRQVSRGFEPEAAATDFIGIQLSLGSKKSCILPTQLGVCIIVQIAPVVVVVSPFFEGLFLGFLTLPCLDPGFDLVRTTAAATCFLGSNTIKTGNVVITSCFILLKCHTGFSNSVLVLRDVHTGSRGSSR